MKKTPYKLKGMPPPPVAKIPDPEELRCNLALCSWITATINEPLEYMQQLWIDSCFYPWKLAYVMAIQQRFSVKELRQWIVLHPRNIIEKARPLAEYLGSLFELCGEISLLSESGYKSAPQRFQLIFNEMLQSEFSDIDKPGGLKEDITIAWREIAALQRLENPYSRDDRFHLWLLMEQAIDRANRDNSFDRLTFRGRQRAKKLEGRFFNPFVVAYRGWVKELDSGSFCASWVSEGQILKHSGKGKAIESLVVKSLPLSKEFCLQKAEAVLPM